MRSLSVAYLEPFDGGSHARFTQAIAEMAWATVTRFTLPARHWKWRMRGSASYFAFEHADALAQPFDLLLASAYLPLAELLGLVPSLSTLPKVLYFHENQLAYPVHPGRADPRDQHFAFTQIVSGLAATRLAFNSEHNRRSFLEGAASRLASMPDAVSPHWMEHLRERSEVWPLPLDLPSTPRIADLPKDERADGPLIVWNHRWEFDKRPEAFFGALEALQARGVAFRLAVCGHRFRQTPPAFDRARERLAAHIEHWGTLATEEAYRALLERAQLCVSTAEHEFFGVSMLEAAHFGARPLVPDRLAYPEHFPAEDRYRDDAELVERLARLCTDWTAGAIDLRRDRGKITRPYLAPTVSALYESRCRELVASARGEGG